MEDDLKLVGERIAGLRDMCDVAPEELAKKLEISIDEYYEMEQGKKDFAFSQLQCIASTLGVDITSLLTGDDPKLNLECLTRSGEGVLFKRNEEFIYRHLASTFKNAKASPFYVVKKYEPEEKFGIYSRHEGEEFDYVLKGTLKIDLGGNVYELNPGDSVYYNSNTPHSMIAVGGKDCELLAMIIK
ncbi:MAG: cupin domain-containing protein [Clostridia bacterium]|nr:cupin domain-containing protein [Clostridia bacterium]